MTQARGEPRLALRKLGQALPRLDEMGDSHTQRDLFALTERAAKPEAGG